MKGSLKIKSSAVLITSMKLEKDKYKQYLQVVQDDPKVFLQLFFPSPVVKRSYQSLSFGNNP